MPRKPSSVFVIVEPSAFGQATGGQVPLQAYREPLDDGSTVDDIVEANFGRHPAGTRIYVVEDTKVDAHDVRVQLEPVDDPRLPDPDEEDHLG